MPAEERERTKIGEQSFTPHYTANKKTNGPGIMGKGEY